VGLLNRLRLWETFATSFSLPARLSKLRLYYG
jgi:hypothetical protein